MAEEVRSFRDLCIWQAGMELVKVVYQLARSLPREERFELSDQMRRAAISVPTNIAEGHARRHTKEYLQHLSIARGSLAELLTLILLTEQLDYLAHEAMLPIEERIQHLRMPLCTLIASLEAKLH
jgi:four helix bundle protein